MSFVDQINLLSLPVLVLTATVGLGTGDTGNRGPPGNSDFRHTESISHISKGYHLTVS